MTSMLLSILTSALTKNNNHLFRTMCDSDSEADVSCPIVYDQAPWPQNNPQPPAPQPSFNLTMHSCPKDDNGVKHISDSESWYDKQMNEMLLEALNGLSESDGELTVTWTNTDRAGRSTSVQICVPRARSHSPRRRIGKSPMPRPIHMPSHQSEKIHLVQRCHRPPQLRLSHQSVSHIQGGSK